jgi:hypothetical protein
LYFVGKNKREAGEAIEKIVKKNPVGLNIGFSSFYVKKTKPNRTEINRFEPVFGSVRFKKLKKNKIGLVVYFGSKPDRTRNAQPYIGLLELLS